ncbi:MAG: chromosomal replication initiator protein DnaA, partial [Pacificimonas sp.]
MDGEWASPFDGTAGHQPKSTPPTPTEATFDPVTRFAEVMTTLAATVPAKTYNSWLKPMRFLGLDGDVALLSLPGAYIADWVRREYAPQLALLFARGSSPVRDVRIIAVATETGTGVKAVTVSPVAAPDAPPSTAETPLPVSLNPRLTLDTYVVGKANELAWHAAQMMAGATDPGFNPLFLHGITGVGKTHLMHAIGWEIRRRDPGARIAYLSAEKFMYEFVSAMRSNTTHEFKDRLRGVDLLMVDDVQFIGGKNSTQEELFHTMNEVVGSGARLVISADRHPQDLEGIEGRVRSRLAGGLVADINVADYELRLNILIGKLAQRAPEEQRLVPDDVVDFLARKVTSNVRELEGALNRVVAFAVTRRMPLTIDIARDVLAAVLRAHTRRVSVEAIQRMTADFYQIRHADMMSARRSRDIARPRQIAMYLAKRLTPRSYPDIGRRFGGRDHTT